MNIPVFSYLFIIFKQISLSLDHDDQGLYFHYMSLLPPAAYPYLDQMVDYDHSTMYKDLYQIAHNMLHWDSLAPQLGLDGIDVADIKHDHRTAGQQRLGYCIVLFEVSESLLT